MVAPLPLVDNVANYDNRLQIYQNDINTTTKYIKIADGLAIITGIFAVSVVVDSYFDGIFSNVIGLPNLPIIAAVPLSIVTGLVSHYYIKLSEQEGANKENLINDRVTFINKPPLGYQGG